MAVDFAKVFVKVHSDVVTHKKMAEACSGVVEEDFIHTKFAVEGWEDPS